MIQRVQTLYLIGAALISVICLFIQMCIWPMALVLGLSLLINIYTIFLYNNRKLQAKFCLFSILLLVCWYILYVVCWNIFTSDDVKEYLSAKLYYDLGDYFGNCNFGGSNFEASIVTSQNALKNYPYTKMREDFALLIMKSKFELAEQSVESRKLERFRDAEDECYGFLNEYPDSKNKSLAEQFIDKCKKITKN